MTFKSMIKHLLMMALFNSPQLDATPFSFFRCDDMRNIAAADAFMINETATSEDIKWLDEYNENENSLPQLVNSGSQGCEETGYFFDYESAYFMSINEYYAGQSYADDTVATLYDMAGNSLSENPANRDRFWKSVIVLTHGTAKMISVSNKQWNLSP